MISIHDHGTKHSGMSFSFSCFFFCCFCLSAFSLFVPSNSMFSNGLVSFLTYRASTLFPKIKSLRQISQSDSPAIESFDELILDRLPCLVYLGVIQNDQ